MGLFKQMKLHLITKTGSVNLSNVWFEEAFFGPEWGRVSAYFPL